MNAKTLSRYLERHGRLFPITPEPPQERKYSVAVVIPVYAEQFYLEKTLDSLMRTACQEVIILVVVNHPPQAPAARLRENHAVSAMLRKRGIFHIDAGELIGGVGEARKIGMDSSLEYLAEAGILCCLDADSPVNANYFAAVSEAMKNHPGCGGGVVCFRHSEAADSGENDAITDYEIFLRYYVAGLKYAGSPYAFHTIGSTIVCSAAAYVKAGGMRIRTGGEDFYFMQALSKVGPIISISETCVYPSPRPSDRVPFGTGPKVREIMGGHELKLDDPQAFILLKNIIDIVNACTDWEHLPEMFEASLPPEGIAFLKENDFTRSWRRIYSNTPNGHPARLKAFHTWFDAFRTLKLIHFCEDRFPGKYSRQSIRNALDGLPLFSRCASKKAALELLRERDN